MKPSIKVSLFVLVSLLTMSIVPAYSQNITGSGSATYIPKFTASTVIGNSGVFDNGGNIGIGSITNLTVRLTLDGTTPTLRIREAAAKNTAGDILASIDLSDNYLSSAAEARIRALRSSIGGSGGFYPTDLVFYTMNNGTTLSEQMRIDYRGYVGMGTATPLTPLQVTGEAVFAPGAFTGAPNLGAGNVNVAGSASGLNFWKRTLTDLSAPGLAGNRWTWYNPDGSARLFTGTTGDVMTVLTSGNIGLGTTSPGAKLVVNGTARMLSTLCVGSDADGPSWNQIHIRHASPEIGFYETDQALDEKFWITYVNAKQFKIITDKDDFSAIQDAFIINRGTGINISNVLFPNGNLGVGISSSPLTKLDVRGVMNSVSSQDGGGLRFYDLANTSNWFEIDFDKTNNWGTFQRTIVPTADGGNDLGTSSRRWGNGWFSGNVGIGTTSVGTAKLAVNGKIEATEVVVQTTVPDYVFEDDYKLMPLSKVEQNIKQNKHLPDIPSAKEVEKTGLNLGEMSSKLLKKIEELTLYVIELKKENESLKKRVSVLEK
jgi:hypothetical protein